MTKQYSQAIRQLAKAKEKQRQPTPQELAELKRIREELAKKENK